KGKGADAASVTDAVLDELIASNPANPDLLKVKIKRILDAAAEGFEAGLIVEAEGFFGPRF
ncbi:MAG TPA: hypothetical protein PKV23_04560, partial [Aestuariivirga sp.]|nr:hypothetical protein [Aestuariivirga sp.]